MVGGVCRLADPVIVERIVRLGCDNIFVRVINSSLAPRRTILGLFLGEAVALSALGGLAGLILGIGLAQLVRLLVPALPVHTPLAFVVLAGLIAIAIGLAAGVLPARRAARLDPVDALRAE